MQLAELQFRESEESRQRLMGVVGRRFQSYSVQLSPAVFHEKDKLEGKNMSVSETFSLAMYSAKLNR